MDLRMLNILACPQCGKDLILCGHSKERQRCQDRESLLCGKGCFKSMLSPCNGMARSEEGCRECFTVEIEEGELECMGCHRRYPIRGGIPRLILPEKLSSQEKKTQESFGYEWQKFKYDLDLWDEEFLRYTHPVGKDFYANKLGLDAGCGYGRYTRSALQFGAEVVGLDISPAVDGAKEFLSLYAKFHPVQANILQLPFKEGVFDFIFSLGVLHHTENPERSFHQLVRSLKKGGKILIWVYSQKKGRAIALARPLFSITQNIPFPVLSILCFLFSFFGFIFYHLPIRFIQRFPGAENLLMRFPHFLTFSPTHSRLPFKVHYNDLFDSLSAPITHVHKSSDVESWFRTGGLKRFSISDPWEGRALGEK